MYLTENNIELIRELDGVFLVQLKDGGDNYLHSMHDIVEVFEPNVKLEELPADLTLLASAQMSVFWTDVGQYRVCFQLLECFSVDVDRDCDKIILRVETPYLDVVESITAYQFDPVIINSEANKKIYVKAMETFDEYVEKRTKMDDGICFMAEESPFSGKGILMSTLSSLYGGKTLMVAYPAEFRDDEKDVTMMRSYIRGEAMVDVYGSDGLVQSHLKVASAMLISAQPGPLGGDMRMMDVCFTEPPIIPNGHMLQLGVVVVSNTPTMVGKMVKLPSETADDAGLAAAVNIFEKLKDKGVC